METFWQLINVGHIFERYTAFCYNVSHFIISCKLHTRLDVTINMLCGFFFTSVTNEVDG